LSFWKSQGKEMDSGIIILKSTSGGTEEEEPEEQLKKATPKFVGLQKKN